MDHRLNYVLKRNVQILGFQCRLSDFCVRPFPPLSILRCFISPPHSSLTAQDQAKADCQGELSFMICSEAMWIDLASLIEGYVLDQDHLTFFWHLLTRSFGLHSLDEPTRNPFSILFPPTNSLQMFDDCHFLSLTKLRLAILRGPFGHGSNQLVSPEFISRSVRWDPQLTIVHEYRWGWNHQSFFVVEGVEIC
jgi:hypothetical protein